MIGPEYFLHASNITRVLSFSAKDVMWLRVLAILASLIELPYFYLQPVVLWEPNLGSAVHDHQRLPCLAALDGASSGRTLER